MKLLLAFISFLSFSIPAQAELETRQVALCKTPSATYGLYQEKGKLLVDGSELTVISSEVSPKTGLNLSTSGVYRAQSGEFQLPSYWRPKSLKISDCQLNVALLSGAPLGLRLAMRRDVVMYIQLYFIYGDPTPDVDLEDLIRRGEAIPLKAHILCRNLDDENSGPLGCKEIVILDKIIPLSPVAPLAMMRSVAAPIATGNIERSFLLESAICGSASKVQARGTAIDWMGQTVVVTSSAAVVSELGANSCTDAVMANGLRVNLRLIRHDFAFGLALLEDPSNILRGSTLNVRGEYPEPANLLGQTVDLLSESSSRHFIPRQNRVIEVRGGLFGSSAVGAPLLGSANEVIGITSHQYLKIHPGSLTRPTSWSMGGAEKSDHLLVIPAQAIANWLDSASEAALWSLSARSVKSGHLVFTEDCPPMNASDPAGDYPIGGGEPVGIGGDSSNYRACKIKVALDERGDSKFASVGLQSWHDELVGKLKKGLSLELFFVIGRERSTLMRSYFYSAESLLKELVNLKKDNAVVVLAQNNGTTIGLDPKLDSSRAIAARLTESARRIYLNYQFGDQKTSNLIRMIYFYSLLMQTEQWTQIRAEEFEEILRADGPYKKSWELVSFIVVGGKRFKSEFENLHAEWLKVK